MKFKSQCLKMMCSENRATCRSQGPGAAMEQAADSAGRQALGPRGLSPVLSGLHSTGLPSLLQRVLYNFASWEERTRGPPTLSGHPSSPSNMSKGCCYPRGRHDDPGHPR